MSNDEHVQNYVRGYNAGWHDAIDAIRRELAKPDKPDGWLDHKLNQLHREHLDERLAINVALAKDLLGLRE